MAQTVPLTRRVNVTIKGTTGHKLSRLSRLANLNPKASLARLLLRRGLQRAGAEFTLVPPTLYEQKQAAIWRGVAAHFKDEVAEEGERARASFRLRTQLDLAEVVALIEYERQHNTTWRAIVQAEAARLLGE